MKLPLGRQQQVTEATAATTDFPFSVRPNEEEEELHVGKEKVKFLRLLLRFGCSSWVQGKGKLTPCEEGISTLIILPKKDEEKEKEEVEMMM